MQSSRRRNLFFLAEPCRPGDYEPRKAKILRRLGGAAVIVGALLGTLLAALLLGIPAEYIDFKAALKQIFSNSNILGKTLQEHLNAFIDEYVLLVSAVVGAGYGFFQLRKAKVGEKELRQIIFERCFDVFNADALAPIAAPRAFGGTELHHGDPTSTAAMKWQNSPARDEIRAKLAEWLYQGAGIATPTQPASKEKELFSWLVMVGRPGAGKSRAAVEFARRVGWREILGSSADNPQPGLKRLRLAAGVYRRSVLGRCRFGDPWDVGQLKQGGADHPEGRLRAWVPRRPTLILLDDPIPGATDEVIRIISERAKDFRYPVRLLVIDHVIPAELAFTLKDGVGWRSSKWSAINPPLFFPEQAKFGNSDVRGCAIARLDEKHPFTRPSDAEVELFLSVTEGNPLLVEAGIDWLKTGRPLAEMTQPEILRERARVIRENFENAGITGAAAHAAIAVATIAGGADRRILLQEFPHLDFGFLDDLFAKFPLDTVDLATRVPGITPELIGDAYVRLFLEDPSSHLSVADAVRMAWRANPSGTLRTMIRRAGKHDPIAAALRAGPPQDWKGSRTDLALAFAENCIRRDGEVNDALREIDRLSAQESLELLPRLLNLVSDPHARGGAGLCCFARAMNHVLASQEASNSAETLTNLLDLSQDAVREICRRGFHLESGPHLTAPVTLQELIKRMGAFPWPETMRASVLDRLERLFDLAWRASSAEARKVIAGPIALAVADAASALEPAGESAAATTTRIVYLKSAAAAAAAKPAEAQALLQPYDTPLQSPSGDRHAVLNLVRAWRQVAYAYAAAKDVAKTRETAEKVDQLSQPYEAERDFKLERVRHWRYVAYAYAAANDVAKSRETAEKVDQLSGPYEAERDFKLERVEAWRQVAYAYAAAKDVAKTRETAEKVDQLSQPYEAERDFKLERVVAWQQVAYAYAVAEDVAKSRETAEKVDQLSQPYEAERDFKFARVEAWRQVAYAYAVANDVARSRETAEKVDRLSQPYEAEHDFKLARVEAWRQVASAYAAAKDVAKTRETAEKVDQLSGPYEAERDFKLERVRAWRYVAWAYSLANDVAKSRETAEKVDQLSGPYEAERDFKLARVVAWRLVAYACKESKDVDGVRSAAREVETRTDGFARSLDFAMEIARALELLTDACVATHDLPGAEAALVKLAKIIADCEAPNNPELQSIAYRAADTVGRLQLH